MEKNTVNINSQEIINICQANDVAMLGVFGSVARGEATEESDIDIFGQILEAKRAIGPR